MKRPLFYFRWYRSWDRQAGWSIVLIVAPFPPEEQIQGELCAALINAEIWVDVKRPFIRAHIYAADRIAHTRRLAERRK